MDLSYDGEEGLTDVRFSSFGAKHIFEVVIFIFHCPIAKEIIEIQENEAMLVDSGQHVVAGELGRSLEMLLEKAPHSALSRPNLSSVE